MSKKNHDNAFAMVKTIGDKTFRLFRHHDVETVRSGLEHDTVDKELLENAFKALEFSILSPEDKEKVKKHLEEHKKAISSEDQPHANWVETEEEGVSMIEQQHGSKPGDPTRLDGKDSDVMTTPFDPVSPPLVPGAEPPADDGLSKSSDEVDSGTVTASPTGSPSPPTIPGVDEKKVKFEGGPAGVVNIAIRRKDGEPFELSEKLTDQVQLLVRESEKMDLLAEANVVKPLDPEQVDSVIPGAPEEDNPMVPSDSVIKDGKKEKNPLVPSESVIEGAPEEKNPMVPSESRKEGKPKEREKSIYAGNIVRNADGKVGIVDKVFSENDIVKSAHINLVVGGVIQEKVEDLEVLVRCNLSDPLNKDLALELRILNTPEALMRFGTPTAEQQENRKRTILMACVDDLTESGKKWIMEKVIAAKNGQVKAKLQGVDILGTVEFAEVLIGEDDEDFPFRVLVEISKNSDGKPVQLSILNHSLPVDILDDFMDFLKTLTK